MWLQWTTPHDESVREFTLAAAARVRTPREIALNGVVAPVGADGRVALPRPVRGRTFRLEILRAAFPPGTSGQDQADARGRDRRDRRGRHPAGRVPRSGPLKAPAPPPARSAGARSGSASRPPSRRSTPGARCTRSSG